MSILLFCLQMRKEQNHSLLQTILFEKCRLWTYRVPHAPAPRPVLFQCHCLLCSSIEGRWAAVPILPYTGSFTQFMALQQNPVCSVYFKYKALAYTLLYRIIQSMNGCEEQIRVFVRAVNRIKLVPRQNHDLKLGHQMAAGEVTV